MKAEIDDRIESLLNLNNLYHSGAITSAELETLKIQILNSPNVGRRRFKLKTIWLILAIFLIAFVFSWSYANIFFDTTKPLQNSAEKRSMDFTGLMVFFQCHGIK